MDSLRLIVTPRGTGFLAKSIAPEVTALGSTPEEAVNAARLMVIAKLDLPIRPSVLLVQLYEPRRCTIVMQPIDEAFSLSEAQRAGWRYQASVTTDASTDRAV